MALREAQLTLEYPLFAERKMSKVYIYVVDRDFGFAPNPFHGYCTLATCKPGIRNMAEVGDWVIGLGGGRLKATGRCIYAMRVSKKITFNDYWSDPYYLDKKPIRNGSSRMLVGDNVYYFDPKTKKWNQADSHHSNFDGSTNLKNLKTDTKSDKVLISDYFYYFGKDAPSIPNDQITFIGYKNGRNYRVFDSNACSCITDWLQQSFRKSLNIVVADPFQFDQSEKRYTGEGSKII
jgi:hypothetical protein